MKRIESAVKKEVDALMKSVAGRGRFYGKTYKFIDGRKVKAAKRVKDERKMALRERPDFSIYLVNYGGAR